MMGSVANFHHTICQLEALQTQTTPHILPDSSQHGQVQLPLQRTNDSQCKGLHTHNMHLVAPMENSDGIGALAGFNKANYTNKALDKACYISDTPAPSDNPQLHEPTGTLLGLVAMIIDFFVASQLGGLGPMAQLLITVLAKVSDWKHFPQLCLVPPVKTHKTCHCWTVAFIQRLLDTAWDLPTHHNIESSNR